MPYKDVVALTVRLPVELHAALAALAQQHDRSLHGEILTAIRAYVAEPPWRPPQSARA